MILKYFCLKFVMVLVSMDLFYGQRFTSTAASSWSLDETENQVCGKPDMAFSRSYYGHETRHGEYPWNAALIHRNPAIGFFCGGTLVSKKLVITAAHCIEGKGGTHNLSAKDFVVILGAHNISIPHEAGKTTAIVKATHVHHDWDSNADSYDADIAILELSRPVSFDEFIQPICLAESGSVAALIHVGYVVGFGKSEKADKEDVARVVGTPIHSNRKCGNNSHVHQQLVSNRGFCGGYANGSGVCTGDSGSGMFVVQDGIYYLRGIVSASLGGSIEGCNLYKYSIFTDILGFFGWITTAKDDKILIQDLREEIRQLMAKLSNTQVTSPQVTSPQVTTDHVMNEYILQSHGTDKHKYGYERMEGKHFHHTTVEEDGVRLGCYGYLLGGKKYSTHYVADVKGYRPIYKNNVINVYPKSGGVKEAAFIGGIKEKNENIRYFFPEGCSEDDGDIIST